MNPELNKLKEGDVKTFVLDDGSKIIGKLIRIDNGTLVYYTEQAIKSMFRPITENERVQAADLHKKDDQWLMLKGYIVGIPANRVIRIEESGLPK